MHPMRIGFAIAADFNRRMNNSSRSRIRFSARLSPFDLGSTLIVKDDEGDYLPYESHTPLSSSDSDDDYDKNCAYWILPSQPVSFADYMSRFLHNTHMMNPIPVKAFVLLSHHPQKSFAPPSITEEEISSSSLFLTPSLQVLLEAEQAFTSFFSDSFIDETPVVEGYGCALGISFQVVS